METNRFYTDSSPVSFGRYIKAIREQMGVDLETVSEALKVSRHKLSLIEAEDHEGLPDDIYIKGTLRAYADYIGIDADDLIDRYEINRAAYTGRDTSAKPFKRHREKLLPRVILLFFLLLIIGGASVSAFYLRDMVLPPEPMDKNLQTPAQIAAETDMTPEEPATDPKGEKLVLIIDTVKRTWIKINIDGEEPLEYLLRPKDHVELEAESYYNLLIGNAGGLRMRLNGTPVHVPGDDGEVVTLKLPQHQSAMN